MYLYIHCMPMILTRKHSVNATGNSIFQNFSRDDEDSYMYKLIFFVDICIIMLRLFHNICLECL